MKRVALLTFLTFWKISIILGQVDVNKNFVYFYSDSVIYGRIIENKTFLRNSYFLVDSIKIQTDLVKFYRNETGFYANTRAVSFSGASSFAERIREGKINLYENKTTTHVPNQYNYTTGKYTGGMSTTNIKNYYNKGFGDLKKANYQNLSLDLADNPESMIYINKYKSKRDVQTVLCLVGGVSIIAGFATLINKTKAWDESVLHPKPNVTGSFVAIGLGAASFWVSYFIELSKPAHLRSAIDKYNE